MPETDKGAYIDEELVCADSLCHCLRSYCGCTDVSIARETNDPPDFWISVDGERYAVEVTSVVEGEERRAACKALLRCVRSRAEQQGRVAGSYALVVVIDQALPKRTSPQWRCLVEGAASFITDTRNVESTEECALVEGSPGYPRIKKLSSRGSCIGSIGPMRAKWENETERDLRRLIDARLAEKRDKLRKNDVGADCSGIILLLYDAYGYGTCEEARKALSSVHGYDWFHSIFWTGSWGSRRNELAPASPGRFGVFLHSRKDKWRVSALHLNDD